MNMPPWYQDAEITDKIMQYGFESTATRMAGSFTPIDQKSWAVQLHGFRVEWQKSGTIPI
jgi:hypothetical protein